MHTKTPDNLIKTSGFITISKLQELLELICKRNGEYAGIGYNQDMKKFRASLTVKNMINNHGVQMFYSSRELEGTDFNKATHLYNQETVQFIEEFSIISYDKSNKLCMWVLNNNVGTTVKYELHRYKHIANEKDVLVFGFGNPENITIFREEISFELWNNGDVSYNYAWGEPDGLFVARSAVRLNKIS